MYETDPKKREIDRSGCDEGSDDITNQLVFVRTLEGEGMPDGMTVDAQGHAWPAPWGGNVLPQFATDGSEEQRIAVSCEQGLQCHPSWQQSRRLVCDCRRRRRAGDRRRGSGCVVPLAAEPPRVGGALLTHRAVKPCPVSDRTVMFMAASPQGEDENVRQPNVRCFHAH